MHDGRSILHIAILGAYALFPHYVSVIIVWLAGENGSRSHMVV